ncbi:adenosylcobyric acid synthase (glutamine-hydrolysing) [Candidatus Desulfosporosinus infrequens]|uniref:Cobyric acid synthase n=1 Tax=Candidatus Desulfosporosinus infrequens TaxID=2043169 RepID=A0A2U3KIR7_9FIRM|nr:adenosylcobyric acid synthase (glutamine-hydrolysing) [Candidatus Desulfosporosinus infrequens]
MSSEKKLSARLMIQGTSSSVGKSVLAAAFCRIFYQEGYRVSPFKAQNMALNSFVTAAGGEMGRAQVVQAQAAGVEPDVRMNPILLKPSGPSGSQVVIMGQSQGNVTALRYHGEYQRMTWPFVQDALHSLLDEYEIVVIEGAGSPAEVNLKSNDIVNMRVALEANSPVLLVADIDRGGALASVVGTLELVEPNERAMIKGIIFNKFRGELALLQPALDFIEQRTGIPVVGVVPYFKIRIPDEDSVALNESFEQPSVALSEQLDVVVIRFPYISNFTDFDALQDEPDVSVRYVTEVGNLGKPDLIILPGSKNTLADLHFLHQSGLGQQISKFTEDNVPLIGICGGYQMMGRSVMDPLHTESELEEVLGLGILPMVTEFYPQKHTVQSTGTILANQDFFKACTGETVVGYEIHMGRSTMDEGQAPLFNLTSNGVSYADGLQAGNAYGTYLHGIFDNDSLRTALLVWLWQRRDRLRPVGASLSQAALRESAFNELADLVRQSVDLERVRAIMGLDHAVH